MVAPSSPGRAIGRCSVGSGPEAVASEVAGLAAVNANALKKKWLSLYGAEPPPRLSRSLLIRALAYRIQERALGGLRPATRRFLSQAPDGAASGQTPLTRPLRAAQPGTVLVREWHGVTHQVTVVGREFQWRGKRYRSLPEMARKITGTRWSGPRFFGLKQPPGDSKNGGRQAQG